MLDSISKPNLPKGYAYVLKTSQLVKALAEAGVDCHINLIYWVPQEGGSLLEGHYWLPNENVDYPRVYVRAGVVPSASRAAASEALLTTGLPQFTRWLQELLLLPDNSTARAGSPYFSAVYTETGLNITYQPLQKMRKR